MSDPCCEPISAGGTSALAFSAGYAGVGGWDGLVPPVGVVYILVLELVASSWLSGASTPPVVAAAASNKLPSCVFSGSSGSCVVGSGEEMGRFVLSGCSVGAAWILLPGSFPRLAGAAPEAGEESLGFVCWVDACFALFSVGGSDGWSVATSFVIEQVVFSPRGSVDLTSWYLLWQAGEAATSTMSCEVCCPLSLRRSTGVAFGGGAGIGCSMCRRWVSLDLGRSSSSTASAPAPARWSFGAVARRLPVRIIKQGLAGLGCGAAMAAAAARLRLALGLRAVEHLRVLVVIFSLCEVLFVVDVPF